MVTIKERRNHAGRAEATRLVVNALLGGTKESDVRDLQAWILPPGATERILKSLAIRGLARSTASGWEPTPPLVTSVSLRLCEGDHQEALKVDDSFLGPGVANILKR
jgi:hypothetical protein